MSIVHNEQTKLIANALDRASTACFTVGIATPLAATVYNIGNFRANMSIETFALGITAWFFASVALHFAGQRMLRRLRQ